MYFIEKYLFRKYSLLALDLRSHFQRRLEIYNSLKIFKTGLNQPRISQKYQSIFQLKNNFLEINLCCFKFMRASNFQRRRKIALNQPILTGFAKMSPPSYSVCQGKVNTKTWSRSIKNMVRSKRQKIKIQRLIKLTKLQYEVNVSNLKMKAGSILKD